MKQDIKFAFRHLFKDKAYTLLSIISLAIGLTISAVIFYYVTYEFSYDKFQKNYSRVCSIFQNRRGSSDYFANTPFVLHSALQGKVPEIEKVAQVIFITWTNVSLNINNNFLPVKNCYYSDPEIFDILSLNLISGNPKSLSDLNSVLISKSYAERYFHYDKNTIGKIIRINVGAEIYNLEIKGIIEDSPENSHFRPDIILPMQLFRNIRKKDLNDWGFNNPVTYVLLNKAAVKNDVERKINSFLNAGWKNSIRSEFHLLPLGDFHLNSVNISGVPGEKGDIKKIYVFSAVALLLLLIACINYINLNVATASSRAKEIGIYKIMGAGRVSLISRLLLESGIISLLTLPLIISAVELLMPYANIYFNRNMHLNLIDDRFYIAALIIFVIGVGIISGIYSAVIISRLSPLEVFRSRERIASSKSYLRRMLISFQFIIFSGMLICSYVIYSQIEYIKNLDPGYKKDNVLVLELPSQFNLPQFESLKSELKRSAEIMDASLASSVPPGIGSITSSEGEVAGKHVVYSMIFCDKDYKNTLGIEMKEGRFFNASDDASPSNKIMINETAEKYFGLKNPLTGGLNLFGQRLDVIGVVKDYHDNSLYSPISPTVIFPSKEFIDVIAVKLPANNLVPGMKYIKTKWNEFFPGIPFTYKFIDEEFDRTYKADEQFGSLIGFFTITAALLAVIGLSGLTSFTTSKKVKEIGIRKVLGASTGEVLLLLNKEISIISLIGCLIAAPIAYYFMEKWLANFAYRASFSIWIFIISFLITLMIAMLTVSFQTIKAALANPVNSLRSE